MGGVRVTNGAGFEPVEKLLAARFVLACLSNDREEFSQALAEAFPRDEHGDTDLAPAVAVLNVLAGDLAVLLARGLGTDEAARRLRDAIELQHLEGLLGD